MVRPHEVNEASILYFQRDRLHDGVHLARVGLRKGESSTFHLHTRTRDTFYVMSGRLTIVLRLEDADGHRAYRGVTRSPIDVERAPRTGYVHRVRLEAGDVFIIEPGNVHCATNLDDDPCHFLCIEGVGEYDFVEMSANGVVDAELPIATT